MGKENTEGDLEGLVRGVSERASQLVKRDPVGGLAYLASYKDPKYLSKEAKNMLNAFAYMALAGQYSEGKEKLSPEQRDGYEVFMRYIAKQAGLPAEFYEAVLSGGKGYGKGKEVQYKVLGAEKPGKAYRPKGQQYKK